jgi:hypothetical protein
MDDKKGTGEVSRTLAGGILLGVIAAGVMGAWAWASDRPECSGEMFACLGEVILAALIGIPAALTLAWLGLRGSGDEQPGGGVMIALLGAGARRTM